MNDEPINQRPEQGDATGATPSPASSATDVPGAAFSHADDDAPAARFPVSKTTDRNLVGAVCAALSEHDPEFAGCDRERAILDVLEHARFHHGNDSRTRTAHAIITWLATTLLTCADSQRAMPVEHYQRRKRGRERLAWLAFADLEDVLGTKPAAKGATLTGEQAAVMDYLRELGADADPVTVPTVADRAMLDKPDQSRPSVRSNTRRTLLELVKKGVVTRGGNGYVLV
ncbi:MAG: hypothetical protein WD795_16420 [Woeseia sp.]